MAFFVGMIKSIISILAGISLASLAFLFASDMTQYGVEEAQVSWGLSYWFPRILTAFAAFLIAIPVFQLLKNRMKKVFAVLLAILVFAIAPTVFLIKYPPYLNDMSKTGTAMQATDIDDNAVENILRRAEYNGLVMVASPGCQYCHSATKRLLVMRDRVPGLPIKILLFDDDITSIEFFKTVTGARDLDYMLSPSRESTLALCGGRFPTFLYFKDGEFVHAWKTYQFGFPARDWVENGLN